VPYVSVLDALIALQRLDSAAETARRRLAELPAAESALLAALQAASEAVATAKARLAENAQARRELEKQVAGVDSRLSRFEDHKAAVKTNQEYTALLHEISTAKTEKDAVEEQILLSMEAADALTAELEGAAASLEKVRRETDTARTSLTSERTALEADIARLTAEKAQASAGVDRAVLTKYEQLLKQRRMVAVAAMVGELCTACHVRMRPAVAQLVRRNTDIIQCDSCQRILYFEPPSAASSDAPPAAQA
jgi:hypothetical protein